MSAATMQRIATPSAASTSKCTTANVPQARLVSSVRPAKRTPVQCSAYRNRDCRTNYGPRNYGNFGNFAGPGMWADGMTLAAQLADLAQKFATSQPNSAQNFENAVKDLKKYLPLDFEEQEEQYVLTADVPGLQKSDLKITINQKERSIKIAGERSRPQQASSGVEVDGENTDREQSRQYRKQYERSMGKFSRTTGGLPEDADLSAVTARVEKGVLTIFVQKTARPDYNDVFEIKID